MMNIRGVLIRFITTFFNWIVFTTLILIVAIVFVQIFFRYILKGPLFWSEELAKFIFPWLIFSGAALASKANSHIRIDFFTDRLPERVRPIIDKIVNLLSFIFCVLVVLYTVPLAESQKNVSSTALSIPLNYYSLSVVVGVIGMVIYTFWGKGQEKRL